MFSYENCLDSNFMKY